VLSVDGFSGLLKGPGRRAGNRRGAIGLSLGFV